jgi:hypothetical protein
MSRTEALIKAVNDKLLAATITQSEADQAEAEIMRVHHEEERHARARMERFYSSY